MNPYLIDALDELKRVDHLVYVSLSYTRTVDVLKSVVDRMISTSDFLLSCIIDDLNEKKPLDEVPLSPALRVALLQKECKDVPEIVEYLKLYTMLRKIARCKYDRLREFRRHVTMVAHFDDDSTMDVNIDVLKEYYEQIKGFFKYVKNMITGESNESRSF